MHRRRNLAVLAIMLTATWFWLIAQPHPKTPTPLNNNTRAHIIAISPSDPEVQTLANATLSLLGASSVRVWQASNGSEPDLPLLTRYTLLTGTRGDSMELRTHGMLGCLHSHIQIWHTACDEDNTTWTMVLEEDARLDQLSRQRLNWLLRDVADEPWDALMLESGHVTVSSSVRHIGRFARTWADPSDLAHNRWAGTRGYILRCQGAQKLLRRANELTVQVDSLFMLTALLDDLRLVWPYAHIAHPSHWRLSIVQEMDRCLFHCFFLDVVLRSWTVWGLLVVGVVGMVCVKARKRREI